MNNKEINGEKGHSRSPMVIMTRLIYLVKPLTGFMILAILTGVLGHLAATFITILGANAVKFSIFPDTQLLDYKFIFFLIGVIAISRGFLRYGEQTLNHYIAFKLLAHIRNTVFSSLRKLAPAKLEGKDRGNLISVITSDIELLEVFYAHTISPIFIALLFGIIMVTFISTYNIYLGLIALISYLAVGVLIPIYISKRTRIIGEKTREISGELSSFVLDSLRGLSETVQFNQGVNRLHEITSKTNTLLTHEKKLKEIIGTNNGVTGLFIFISSISMLLASINLVDIGSAIVCTVAMLSSFGPFVSLAALGSTLQHTFAAGNRVLDILDERPLVEEVTGKPEISFTGAAVKNVSFSYNQNISDNNDSESSKDNMNVLDNFSVDIPSNKIIGIIGKSGSGKSTLLKLLMRFWNVTQGRIEISGTSIDDINTSNLRELQGYVTQETHLFHDSIRNNLKIANLSASDEEIINACKKASIHDFIEQLPNGYDTMVGELGDTLSGGERQRIGLARAFLHDSSLIMLDEPTSNLDSLNESIILKSLDVERKGRTIILISHRKSTMGITDVSYSVEHGRIT